MTAKQMIEVSQKKSFIAVPKKVRTVLKSLGLKGIGSKKQYKDNNCIRGMINKVSHLVSYEIIKK